MSGRIEQPCNECYEIINRRAKVATTVATAAARKQRRVRSLDVVTAPLQPSKLHDARQPLSVSISSPCSKNMSPH